VGLGRPLIAARREARHSWRRPGRSAGRPPRVPSPRRHLCRLLA